MEVLYKAANGRLTFKITGDPQTIFREITAIDEVFDSDTQCGVCGSQNLKFRHRRAQDKYDYYELACQERDCRARLSFGQKTATKDLFPKRKDADGNWLPNRGWQQFKAKDKPAAEAHKEAWE
jgi:hypothetical protein